VSLRPRSAPAVPSAGVAVVASGIGCCCWQVKPKAVASIMIIIIIAMVVVVSTLIAAERENYVP